MKINIVFDRISPDGTPVENLIPCYDGRNESTQNFTSAYNDLYLKPFWQELSDYNFLYKYPYKMHVDFVRIDELTADDSSLNLYPIRTVGNGGYNGFITELLLYLSIPVILAVREKKLKLCLVNFLNASYDDVDTLLIKIGFYAKELQIPPSSILLIACDCENFTAEFNRKSESQFGKNLGPKAIDSYMYEKFTRWYIDQHDMLGKNYIDIYKSNIEKEKLFICLTNHGYAYRYNLYKMLEYKNLLSSGFISWREATSDIAGNSLLLNENFSSIIYKENFEEFYNFVTNNRSISQTILEDDCKDKEFDCVIVGSYYNENWVKNSWFTLYSESNFFDVFLSEKTYKLFYYGHPFIIYGCKGILAKIRSLGYKTFPMLFDEAYDDMDHITMAKLDFITEQIKFYTTDIGKAKLLAALPEVLEVIEYNRQVFLNKDGNEFWRKAL